MTFRAALVDCLLALTALLAASRPTTRKWPDVRRHGDLRDESDTDG